MGALLGVALQPPSPSKQSGRGHPKQRVFVGSLGPDSPNNPTHSQGMCWAAPAQPRRAHGLAELVLVLFFFILLLCLTNFGSVSLGFRSSHAGFASDALHLSWG